jgi:hypothetical protein
MDVDVGLRYFGMRLENGRFSAQPAKPLGGPAADRVAQLPA